MRLRGRVRRLERRNIGRLPDWARRYLSWLAGERALPVAEVVAAAETLRAQAAAAGVLDSAERLAAFLAAQTGRDAIGVLAEAEGGMQAWRARDD